MTFALPKSLNKDLHSLDEEVAFSKGLSPMERLEVVAMVCRTVRQQLLVHPKREQVLAGRDALPESTVKALKRLRNGG